MNVRRLLLLAAGLWLSRGPIPAQSPNSPPEQSGGIIRTETRLVLGAGVARDKKGGYIGALTAKDFKIWEDKKEQGVKTFSHEGSLVSPTDAQKQYLIFLFAATSMSPADQARARQTAAKF